LRQDVAARYVGVQDMLMVRRSKRGSLERMRRDVHRDALRVAVRVALMVGSIEGCRTAPGPDASTAVDSGARPGEASAPAASQSVDDAHASPPAGTIVTDCRAVVAAAFPVDGEYPGVRREVPTQVRSCCAHLLADPGMGVHRWDCCANVDEQSEAVGLACTPWGPPMPPAMAHREVRRKSTVLDLRALARDARPTLPVLPALVDAAVGTWRARMINEYGSAEVFVALADQLARAGLHEHKGEVLRFADEERRHGVLCGAVVEALGGEAIGEITTQHDMPAHDDAPRPLEAVLRNVISICCMSETVAVALIGAERFAMPKGELRDLLTRIWADEIGHARFGWRLLARVAQALDDAARERLGDWLEVAFAHLVEHELAHLPLAASPPPEGIVYGLCNGAEARRLFADTVAHAIVPGLAAHGLPAARAWRNRAGVANLGLAGTS
jgi:hypothetical protein